MKTNNNSLADKQAAKTDTPNALISDNDLLKFFNLEKRTFRISQSPTERTECTSISHLIRHGFSVLYADI